MSHFVLVHGAWHGGWCWAPLARELEERGHDIVTPDLPCNDLAADLQRYADTVGPHPDAIVVGHSFGGFVLPLIDAKLHVYLNAFVPAPGRPPADVLGDALHPDFGGTERDGLGRSYWPSVDILAQRLYRGHGRPWPEWAFPRLRPQAQTPSLAPHPLGAMPTTRSEYILARDDPSIRPDWSRSVARDVLGIDATELPGGHFPMLDRPAQLADILESFETDR